MKRRLNDIIKFLFGVIALICMTFIAFGRLIWKAIRDWWKNRSKKARKLTRYAIIACVTCIVGKGCFELYDALWGECDWRTETCSENVEVHFFNDNTKRLFNTKTKRYTTPRMDWIVFDEWNDTIGVYAINDKRGYVNLNDGEIIIEAEKNQYEMAWVFSEGLAAVMKDGKVGFVNMENEIVIPFQFNYDPGCGMWNLGFVFHEGLCCMTSAENKLGLINTAGEWVVEAEYDEIWVPCHDHRILIKNNKYGVADINGQIIYPAEYGYIDILSDGFVLTKGGKRWQVDREGKTIVDFMFDETYDLYYPDNSFSTNEKVEYYSPFACYRILGRYGIFSRTTGKAITPAIYLDVEQLSYTLFKVQTDNMDWTLLDTDGNIVMND